MKNTLVLAMMSVACLIPLAVTSQEAQETQAQAVQIEPKPSDSQTSSPNVDVVEFSQIAPKVWLHTSYKNVEPWGLIYTNGLIFEREDYSVLIDTAWNDKQTAQILEWAKTDLNKPIKASIHTHAHSDKMGGMLALHQQGINTFAHSMSNELAPTHDLLPAKNNLNIKSIGDKTEWEGLTVLYPGGGHTHDNIVVYDGTSEIIFGGCLIRPGKSRSLGYTGDAHIEHWSQAAQNVADAFPSGNIVIPSHGKPGGREVLTNTIEIAKPKG